MTASSVNLRMDFRGEDMRQIALVTLFLITAWTPGNLSAEELKGALVYEQHCGRCHNYRAPDERSDREWSIIVAHMRAVGMMTGRQTEAVLQFLQESNNPPLEVSVQEAKGERPSPEAGKTLFEKSGCVACHALHGTGGSVGPALDNLFKNRSIDYVKGQIINPKTNNPTSIMPSYPFSEGQVQSVIEYLRTLRE